MCLRTSSSAADPAVSGTFHLVCVIGLSLATTIVKSAVPFETVRQFFDNAGLNPGHTFSTTIDQDQHIVT